MRAGVDAVWALFDFSQYPISAQRLAVARLIEDAGWRTAAFGLDDLRDPVTH